MALERELEETRQAAVEMMLGMLDVVARTPDEREAVARGFERAAAAVDPQSARFARLMAAAIRRRIGPEGSAAEKVNVRASQSEDSY